MSLTKIHYSLAILMLLLSLATMPEQYKQGQKIDAAKLGELLFHDKILSRDLSVSCASCHLPAFAFADTIQFSLGIDGQPGTRNTPSAMNVLARRALFWDGRAATLEEHALQPIANPLEMDLPIPEALKRLNDHEGYSRYFMEVYGKAADSSSLANALAEFQRTLETSDTPWDRFALHGEEIDPAVIRGKAIFDSKGMCLECHFTPDFTADEFKNVGIFDGINFKDVGRYGITGDSTDLGRFKVPGLRNVAITAPYMHNGMFKTLHEVLEFYNDTRNFVANPINQDPLLKEPLGLTENEMDDVVAFLKALTDDRFAHLLD
ncbi:MAG: cytochrome-c peroxidase [Saprospirales bacterium]|nr:MAG: cytochrome-c peroxidase [Saprospirales bacterium]